MKNEVLKLSQLTQKKIFWNRSFGISTLVSPFCFNPCFAASDAPMFSLANTDFVVAIAFVIFVGVLIYFKVPRVIANLLDNRAETIRSEIDEAHKLLEEAKTLLAKLEREHKENIAKGQDIIQDAKLTSKKILEDSKSEIKDAVARKLAMAERQIKINEKEVINAIRDDLIDAAFKAAQEQIEKKVDLKLSNSVVEESIAEIGSRLS
ncbi:MAG: ATP F0F1 synthase subunit B [Pseudomonadota bacterium]|nr:ATP F0F1 synthase subunit B [Pseudomonadota bacterium]